MLEAFFKWLNKKDIAQTNTNSFLGNNYKTHMSVITA